jgi:hypothetical protein
MFLPIADLPPDHRYFAYQRTVNGGGVPSEEVIAAHRREFGGEYRFATEGEHPIPALREQPEGQLVYEQVTGQQAEPIAARQEELA